MIETLHCLNPLEGSSFGVCEVVGDIHHIDSEAHKAAHVLVHHIACPTGPHGSQPCTMRHIEHTAEFMFQLMGCPVITDTTPSQSVVHQTAAPHNLGTITVVFGILEDSKHGVLHAAQQGFSQICCQVHVVVFSEITLHRVHHHVSHTCRCLIRGQSEGAARIHDGKFGTGKVVGIAEFHIPVLVGNHTGLAHLAACSRNGEHSSQWQHGSRFCLALIEIPHIALVWHSIGDALGGVNDTTASNGKDEINTFPTTQFDAFLSQRKTRIGHHTPQFHEINTCLLKQTYDFHQEPRTNGTLPTIMHQHFRSTILLD